MHTFCAEVISILYYTHNTYYCTFTDNQGHSIFPVTLESATPTVPPVLEEEIPAHMQPLCIQLGCIKRVYQCQVEGCKEGPSTSHATICAHVRKVHLGVGLVCPSCGRSFFNPDTFRHHKKGHTHL